MGLKLKKKTLIMDISAIMILLFVFIVASFFMSSSAIQFSSDRNVEINSIVDYSKFIEEVKDGNIEDIKIDSSGVDTTMLGEYTVTYKIQDKSETLKINVVDTTAPQFKVVNGTVALHQKVNPEDFVSDIIDATTTTVFFENNFSANKEGKQEVEITVRDEAKNSTTHTVTITVKKDSTAPTIIASHENIIVGQKIDLKKLAKVTDDMDKNPVVTVNQGDFDVNKEGTYEIEYVAKDASGNESKKTIKIQVMKETSANEKVVYLTFDDGPSKYTPEVLKILDQYNCKATFFITGMNASYRKYIKEAADLGHTIGLHTYSHNYSKLYSSVDNYFNDLTKIGNLAKDYLGYVPKYIRFPGGSSNAVSKKYSKGIMTTLTKMVEEKGYIYYDWNAENGDGYSNLSKNEMYRRATSSKQNKIMILMHDANGKQNTVDILPQVIEYYQSKGYKFKAIDDSAIVPHQRVNN